MSAQRAVNLYAEQQPPDARAPLVLNSVAGLATFATVGAGPIRGLATLDDVLYAVSGYELYRVAPDGTATLLGAVGGNGPVDMSENGVQLVIVANSAAYVTDGSTLKDISDPDFPGAGSVAYLDGYHIFNEPNTGRFFLSALLAAGDFDALDFASAESSPDPLVRVFVDHRELWLFGSHSVEVWINTGASPFPFERQPGSVLERGCAAALSVAKLDNTVFWLGEDRIVYRAQGYAPSRVSTHAIEQALADADAEAVRDARALTVTADGHAFYYLTIPRTGTFGYDAATGLWHERDSRRGGASIGRWRAQGAARAYDRHFVGDDLTGAVYALDPTVYAEGSEALVRLADSPPLHADGARMFMGNLEIIAETGVGLGSGQGSDPQMMLQWSDDGGRTWSSEHWAGMGAIGQYRRRVRWHRLGSFRERVIRIMLSDPVACTIIGANAELSRGLP